MVALSAEERMCRRLTAGSCVKAYKRLARLLCVCTPDSSSVDVTALTASRRHSPRGGHGVSQFTGLRVWQTMGCLIAQGLSSTAIHVAATSGQDSGAPDGIHSGLTRTTSFQSAGLADVVLKREVAQVVTRPCYHIQ